MKNILYTIILSFLFSSVCLADWEAGVDAYDAGDFQTALKNWIPLAEQGDARAQIHVYMMHSHGEGVTQNDKEAMRWLRLAVEQGDARAQFELGGEYKVGLSVTRDFKEAMKWHRLAAEQGYADAQFALGTMYLKGQGAIKDYVIAYMWFNVGDIIRGIDLSADRGWRKKLVKKMTSEQIAKAQELARKCVKKNYKDCG